MPRINLLRLEQNEKKEEAVRLAKTIVCALTFGGTFSLIGVGIWYFGFAGAVIGLGLSLMIIGLMAIPQFLKQKKEIVNNAKD